MNFATLSAILMAGNIGNEAVTLHRSQEVLKMLSLAFLTLREEVLVYSLQLH
jgi:hypothetical protein